MNQPELGKKIAILRKSKGLTQEELVEKCNLNVRTLQRIESGEVTPRIYTLKIIFTALDYNSNDSMEIISGGFSILYWLEQFYRYVLDLFNLKTNTMKKISILSIMFSAIILGLFAVITDGKGQNGDKTISQAKDKSISEQTISRELAFSNFTAYGSFKESDFLIGRDISFKLAGVSVNVKLISLNTKTREFKSTFVYGTLFENKAEVFVAKDELVDNLVMYTADKVEKSDGKIILKGHAKITSSREEYIETDEIIINSN